MHVDRSAEGRYLSIWRDDSVGPWIARHGLTSAEYQAEYNKWTKEGYFPLSVGAGGAGASARYAVVFVKRGDPYARQFEARGLPATPTGAFATIEQKFMDHMQARNVRAASVAIAKDGRLVFARAYTWAEPGYPVTEPTTVFRLASVTKPITAIAMFQLREQGKFPNGFGTKVQSILGLHDKDGNPPIERVRRHHPGPAPKPHLRAGQRG